MKILAISIVLWAVFWPGEPSAQDRAQYIVQLAQQPKAAMATSAGAAMGLRPVRQLSKSQQIWLMQKPGRWETSGRDHSNGQNGRGVSWLPKANFPVMLRNEPNDPMAKQQWPYENDGFNGGKLDADIDLPEAWKLTTGGTTAKGETIVVAVIDAGIDLAHPDLANNLWVNPGEIAGNGIDDDGNGFVDDIHGWNFVEYGPDIGNQGRGHSHGTAVSGIIGAEGNNGLGVTGVNWQVKIMNLVAYQTVAEVIAAYDYVLHMRRRYRATNGREGALVVVANTALGHTGKSPEDAPAWCHMFDALGREGILSVAATANKNIDVDVAGDMPSSCPSDFLVSVTNTTAWDTKAPNAAYGLRHIDMGAPGAGTITLGNHGTYGRFGGTSAAAPHVSGAIALLCSLPIGALAHDMAQQPEKTAKAIKKSLMEGVDPLEGLAGLCVSGGRLNVHKSMKWLARHYGRPDLGNAHDMASIRLRPYPIASAGGTIGLEVFLGIALDLAIVVWDSHGSKVYAKSYRNLDAGRHRIALSVAGLVPGMYIIQANHQSTKLMVR